MSKNNLTILPALKLFLSTIAAMTFLSACAPNVRQEVQKSVEMNLNAETKEDWEQSWYHPQNLFSNWNDHAANSKYPDEFQNTVCETLLNLESAKLTVFETEFEDTPNQELLSPCFTDLREKLDAFYDEQAYQVANAYPSQMFQKGRTKFANKIYSRNLSKGYHTQHGDLRSKEVIITFDDGPHRTLTPQILESLKATGAKAIFLTVGRNAKAYPDLIRRASRDGHMVGSHTYNHPCLGTASTCRGLNKGKVYDLAAAKNEISAGHNAVKSALGWVDPFFRFPYGAATSSARQYLKDSGIADLSWNVDSNDWRQQSVKNLLSSTLRQVENQNRGIILFHDIQRRTAEAMPSFLDSLYIRGFDVVLIVPSNSNPNILVN